MLNRLDEYLDQITMYKLLLYYLSGLVIIAWGFSVLGILHFSSTGIAGSVIYLLAVCWVLNQAFSRLLKVPSNSDSTLITAMILALILPPLITSYNLQFLTAAAGLAIASKYLLTLKGKHIFNPAAIAVVLLALGPKQTADWWIGNPTMATFVILGGFLLVRRIRRGVMVTSFFATALIATSIYAIFSHANVPSTLHQTIFSSALLFMGFVMLTEPLTSPTTKGKQVWYSILDGVLFSPKVHLGSTYSTPELVLSVGNIFTYIIGPRIKLFPKLTSKSKTAPDSFDFVFSPGQKFNYKPGQYLEWMLPHDHVDSRGQRRYFTLASSPTEPNIRLGVKFYPHGSSFKQAMLEINQSSHISATSLGGDFVMPDDHTRPLVFIAGGIGITPYRSMVKYLLDKKQQRSVTLIYSANTSKDIAYRNIFDQAKSQLGLKLYYVLTKQGSPLPGTDYVRGPISTNLINDIVTTNENGLYYISGPHAMVDAIKKMLIEAQVGRNDIKTDFFSGYA